MLSSAFCQSIDYFKLLTYTLSDSPPAPPAPSPEVPVSVPRLDHYHAETSRGRAMVLYTEGDCSRLTFSTVTALLAEQPTEFCPQDPDIGLVVLNMVPQAIIDALLVNLPADSYAWLAQQIRPNNLECRILRPVSLAGRNNSVVLRRPDRGEQKPKAAVA